MKTLSHKTKKTSVNQTLEYKYWILRFLLMQVGVVSARVPNEEIEKVE